MVRKSTKSTARSAAKAPAKAKPPASPSPKQAKPSPPESRPSTLAGAAAEPTVFRQLSVELRSVEQLIPYARNARTHSDDQVAQIAGSIVEFGFTNPVLIDEENGIIAGHGRVLAARKLDLEFVPTITIAGLTPAQKRAYILADNKIPANAGWDMAQLRLELQELDTGELDLTLTGFSTEELEDVLTWEADPEHVPAAAEEIPEVPERPVSQLGDVWLLDRHRLMCGDSTVAHQMEVLMAGDHAVCSVTDPPYSVEYEESHKTRGGDTKVHGAYKEGSDPTAVLEFLETVPTDLLIWSYSVNRDMFQVVDALRTNGWEVRKELIWVKDSFSFWAGAAYQQRHEPIWICTRNNASFRGNVDSKQSTVLEYPRPKAHDLHPTAKPVALWKRLITNHSDAKDLIVEPFSGSGTSIIAAHLTNRRCNAMELAPQYVDVAIHRWQNLTGRQATLEATGEVFEVVAQRREIDTRSHDSPDHARDAARG